VSAADVPAVAADRREERVVRERRPLTGDRQLLGRRRAASRSISPRRGWLKKLSTAATTLSERVWLRPTWPARPPRDGGVDDQPSAFRDRSGGPEPRAGGVGGPGLLDIQAALQDGDQPEGRAGGRADGRRRTPGRHLPWGSGRACGSWLTDLPVKDIHDTNTTPVPRERQRCRASRSSRLAPVRRGVTQTTRESTDDRSPTLARREDQ